MLGSSISLSTPQVPQEMALKYISIDIETLGLDWNTCDMIEFGAVIDDLMTPLEECPRFHCYLPKELYRGQPYAMSMHATILRRIAVREEGWSYIPAEYLGESFANWLVSNGYERDQYDKISINAAGKNFGSFDNNFLNLCPAFNDHIRVAHRVVDPAMLYLDPKTDKKLPDSKTCLQRAGVDKPVAHTAVEDALDVCYLLRKKWQVPV